MQNFEIWCSVEYSDTLYVEADTVSQAVDQAREIFKKRVTDECALIDDICVDYVLDADTGEEVEY